MRITAPRVHAYEIVLGEKKPVTAYDVLNKLGKHLDNPKPPTAYRALDFLTQHGFIHRIESLNAYVPCTTDHKHTGSQFLICKECGRVEDVHLCTIPPSLDKKILSAAFKPEYWNFEVNGLCSRCSKANAINPQ
ncbi:MAG: Fur family transcriptional regulator [Alphaproteobacteria bacterium]